MTPTLSDRETTVKGGSWLLQETLTDDTFTPEQMSEEQRLIHQTADEFTTEVVDQNEQLETKDWDLARKLLKRSGDLGLLGTDVPEEYGGFELDKVSSAIIAGTLGKAGSFSAAFGAHTGLTILPIRMFGTETQKQKYLPGLVSGDIVGAYCLSENSSGSDALGAKAKAIRNDEGHYVLTGEKMWITNGGFADLYIVFAKVDGTDFTAFIVERSFDGVSTGQEEHKMGLHGSSTTPVLFQDVIVPAENLLGEVGKGHKVAFNVLNYGRFKLGASTVGGAQAAVGESARYAKTRHQFGQPIATFGAIKQKLGEMTCRAYAVESMVYRTAGLIDVNIEQNEVHTDDEKGTAVLRALEEFAIESSILKVAGSEALNYILDENIQIHGGNGFVKDYPAERRYRDSRVNRIFEGTNEINRLLIPGMLIKRSVGGSLPLIAAVKKLQDEILGPRAITRPDEKPLPTERTSVVMFKKVALAVLGLTLQRFGDKVSDQQEILSYASDILIDTYAADSVVTRARNAIESNAHSASLQSDAATCFVNDAAMRIDYAARSALAAICDGDTLQTHLAGLRKILKVTPVNTVSIRRRLADATVEREEYIF
jgi:alkylation response protein AidB-like acyl-CoA dehydrogenase